MSLHPRVRLTGAAAMLAALALTATSLPAFAQSSGDINVTGSSIETIELTITDDTAAFGASLTPDGTGAGAEVDGTYVDLADPSTGTCFYWDGTNNATVRSNVAYDLLVDVESTSPDVTQLRFQDGAISNWATCIAGTPVATPMFATPWQSDNATRRDRYDTHLGLVILWEDGPIDAATAITLTAQAQ